MSQSVQDLNVDLHEILSQTLPDLSLTKNCNYQWLIFVCFFSLKQTCFWEMFIKLVIFLTSDERNRMHADCSVSSQDEENFN